MEEMMDILRRVHALEQDRDRTLGVILAGTNIQEALWTRIKTLEDRVDTLTTSLENSAISLANAQKAVAEVLSRHISRGH